MKTALVSLLLGFVVAVWLTPVVRRLAVRLNLLDRPGDARHVHEVPVSRIGGLAIAAGVFAPLLGLALYENGVSALMYEDARSLVALLAGAIGALIVGLLDDLVRPAARWRLLALVGIAAVTWQGGHRLDALGIPFLGVVELGYWSLPVTVLWIVAVIVAFNFIDGLDGLAAGVALIGAATMFLFAYLEGNFLWMTWTGAMCGALVGFLAFNFHPASIFMGDSGSNFLGYLMAVVALQTSRKQSTTVALLVPMLVLGLPLLDAALTMIRRALLREGMFTSERGHLHHRLLERGLSHRNAVLVLYGVSVLLAVAALALVARVPLLHVAAAVGITVVVFGLMFAVGYLRPRDLQGMWRRGRENEDRQRRLDEACDEAARLRPGAGWDAAGLRRVLERVLLGGGISGIVYRAPGADEVVAGDWDAAAKGLRATVGNGDGRSGEALVFWRGRTSGASGRELAALRRLLAAIEGRPLPGPPPGTGDGAAGPTR